MKHIASLHAYDVLDQVSINLIVRRYPDYEEGPSQVVMECHEVLLSRGSDNAREWLQDALVALLESI